MLPKIDELREIAKRTKAGIINSLESKLDSTVLDPEIYTKNYAILRFNRNRHGGGVACYIRTDISTLAINWILFCQMKLKILHSTFWCHTQNRSPLELFTNPLISLNFLIFLKEFRSNSTQAIVIFTSYAISTLIFLKTENIFLINPRVIAET